ncbi:MAG: hypothetical protein H0V82_03765 [Candidatus Protochlamydia sp.]|nr:hypothetical protein [Candidatus Protochlamydia sp.]
MLNFIDATSKEFSSFYQDHSYFHPSSIDLENVFPTYSINERQPELTPLIMRTLSRHITGLDKSLLEVLKQRELFPQERELVGRQFTLLNGVEDPKSIVLEDPEMQGWLIKQNFSYGFLNGRYGMIVRRIFAPNIPFWLFPLELWYQGFNKTLLLNSPLNPLRVVMLKRARKCIRHFNLDRVLAAKEYLFRLPDTPLNIPSHKKFIVISKKISLLSPSASQEKFIRLSRENPEELREIIRQICVVIKHSHLSDNHLNNIRFAADGTNRVCFIDGEPNGGLIEISDEAISNGKFDFALFPIIGLNSLCEKTPSLLRDYGWNGEAIASLMEVMESVIVPYTKNIISERRNYYIKLLLSIACPLIPLILVARAVGKIAIRHLQQNSL